MRSIIVCPLSKLDVTLKQSRAKRVISLLSDDTAFQRPAEISSDNHLLLRFNDITMPTKGLVSPAANHLLEIVDFATQWDWSTPLLIHCWAGISRSPAAAAIIALALEPSRDEPELAVTLRQLSASITPNIKMIEIADQLLGRNDRFLLAIQGIGRGEDAFEGDPFELQLLV